ncbi:MAG: hypothetical protein HY238_27795 [Acidobacteria bacterium]|nr:hypothetical protein [Acidobacteriota bacterium]
MEDLKAVRAWTQRIAGYIDRWSREHGVDARQAAWLRQGVLENAFPALLLVRRGEERAALRWVRNMLNLWISKSGAAPDQEPELLHTFRLAIAELGAAESNGSQARVALRKLMVHLGFSQDELGRMFGVAGETIRRWERGVNQVPAKHQAELVSADAAVERLLQLFRPQQLPQVIRRKAELFEGERALDWILRGRIADVADRYEAALTYQG